MVCDDAALTQTNLASSECAGKKRETRRERFLGGINALVPWAWLEAPIEPHYPKSGNVSCTPIGRPRMLRMYFFLQCHGCGSLGAAQVQQQENHQSNSRSIGRAAVQPCCCRSGPGEVRHFSGEAL